MGKKQAYSILFAIIFLSIFTAAIFAQNEAQPEEQAFIYKKVIFFVMQDSRDLYQVGVMDENGKNKKVLTNSGNNWCPSVSPAGDKVAFFSDRTGFANLWLMDADGRQQVKVTSDLDDIVKIDLFNRGQIAWEKEGESVYFLKKGDIWKIFKEGETPSAITKNHDITSFKLSPDGNRFIFAREKTKKHSGLWSMQVKGTGLRQIFESTVINLVFDWGDDNILVFFHDRGISTMTYVGVEKKDIKECFYLDNDIAWSKNGPDRKLNKIAYISSDYKNEPNIWIMNYDGTEAKQITEKGGFSPFWLPDGKSFVYVEGSDIFRINIETKERTRLTYFFRAFYPVYKEIQLAGTEAAKAKATGVADADKK
jgi:Tol biopolymer transport system component